MNAKDATSTAQVPHVSDDPACKEQATVASHNCEKSDPKPTAVSLGSELEVLCYAVQGVQILVDTVRHGDAADQDIEVLAPHACSAMLTLVASRMRLVIDTITDRKEVRSLVERHNAVATSVYGIQQDDILLPIGNDFGK